MTGPALYYFISGVRILNSRYAMDQTQSLKWEKGLPGHTGGNNGDRIRDIQPNPGGCLGDVGISDCTNPGRGLHEV